MTFDVRVSRFWTTESRNGSATKDAAEWLSDYLTDVGGGARSADVKNAAKAVGHSDRTLTRARQKLRITAESQGFPRVTYWILPTETTVR